MGSVNGRLSSSVPREHSQRATSAVSSEPNGGANHLSVRQSLSKAKTKLHRKEMKPPPIVNDNLWSRQHLDPSYPPSKGSNPGDQDKAQEMPRDHALLQMTDGAVSVSEDEGPPTFNFDHTNPHANSCLASGIEQGADSVTVREECIDHVVSIFPGIWRDFVSDLYETGIAREVEQITAHILDQLEKGVQYPTAKEKLNSLKRKRELDEDEEAEEKYKSVDRAYGGVEYGITTRAILSAEFVTTPMGFIDRILADKRYHLYPTYQVLEEAERGWDSKTPTYTKLKYSRKPKREFLPDAVEATIDSATTHPQKMLALRELQAARAARKKTEAKIRAERQAALEEEENLRRAEKEGQMAECGCCFSDHPLNRMVHCDNDEIFHWFCRPCAKKMAETEIGSSKYELCCMSMDGCQSLFRRDQVSQFLDHKTLIAIDRNEQEAMLRMAGIENLASCPFCPFAAEYPPVNEDRLFRCQAPECEKVSCRLCNLESHVPKTCEEYKKETGLSVRRQIEEAMSAALIRKCNKCGTPFVKEEGCNKMTCTRNGCYNIQCYVCSKSCSYDHFDDRGRGGKAGNCPLFENVEERHSQEVKQAEKIALDKVRAEHPEYTEEDLKIRVSDDVRRDEERRKGFGPRLPHGVFGPNIPAGAGAPFGAILPPPADLMGYRVAALPQFPPAMAQGPLPPINNVGPVHDQFGVREDDLVGMFGPLAEAEFPHLRRDPMLLRPFGPQGVPQAFVRPAPLGVQQQAPPNVNQGYPNQLQAAAAPVPVQQHAHRRRR